MNKIKYFTEYNDENLREALEISKFLEEHPELPDVSFRFGNDGDYSGRGFRSLLAMICQ